MSNPEDRDLADQHDETMADWQAAKENGER